MGEKSGSLTNMIITLVALVAILLVVHTAFPSLTETVVGQMEDIIGTFSDQDITPPEQW